MTVKYERLSSLMMARLRDLGMKTWRDLSTKAGISYETLRAVRAGSNPSDGTVYALEKALRWAPGSFNAILADGLPTPLATSDSASELDPDVRGEDETALEWMDRQYELWKQDRDKRTLLKGLFESWGNRSAS